MERSMALPFSASSALRLLVVVSAMMMMMMMTTTEAFARRSRAPTAKIRVDGDNHWFLDEFGRVRIFHGVNSVRKGSPWYYEYLLNDTRLDDLRAFGLNVVRLGTMWSGVEPQDGVFNATYVGILETIIQKLADRGIYALLDMHQDVMSSLYFSYDGIPLWLVETFPEPTNPYPWPLESVDAWAEGYLTQACSEGFQMLYNDTNDALVRWGQFWAHVAQTLGPMPAVLGYDYMNEPWVGDYILDPGLLLPGVAGQVNLVPVYDYLHSVIRQHDVETIQFYEPITYGVVFEGNVSGNGFDAVPGGPGYADLSAYSYHTYCWSVDLLPPGASDEERLEAVAKCTDILLPKIFQTMLVDIERTGGAAMLTEYGLCKTSGDAINILCEDYMNLADEYLQSWVDWDYSDGGWYDQNGNRNMAKIQAYARPYPTATAGIPLNITFNSTTLRFEFRFAPDIDIEAPTEIYVPSLRYTDGYDVTFDPVDFGYIVEGDWIYVFYTGALENFPDEATVVVTPATSKRHRLWSFLMSREAL